MARYRKKPVVVEAFQWQAGQPSLSAFPAWFGDANPHFAGDTVIIKTPEGNMRASPGDWIIKGGKGEIYPCKPDIFAQTYEPEAA